MADLETLRRHAERCVTHHDACDCGQYERALLVEVEQTARVAVRGWFAGGKDDSHLVWQEMMGLATTLEWLDAWRAERGAYGD